MLRQVGCGDVIVSYRCKPLVACRLLLAAGLAAPCFLLVACCLLLVAPRLPHQRALHHRITWAFMAPGSVLRVQLERLARGEALSSLAELKAEIVSFRFISVVERIQEGDHSLVNRHGGKRAVSAAYVSLIQRLPELEMMLNPCFQKELCMAFTMCRSKKLLSQLFRFQLHPAWRELGAGKKGRHKIAVAIVYSTDVASQNVLLKGQRTRQARMGAIAQSGSKTMVATIRVQALADL